MAQAAVTVTQDGGDLYVVGDNTSDSVQIYQDFYELGKGIVRITDNQTNDENLYENVDKVWVDTGNGEDCVTVLDTWTFSEFGADVSVKTGNGKDEVYIKAIYTGDSIEVATGKGEDYVQVESSWTSSYDGLIAIETGNGKDEVCLSPCWYGDFDIALGKGDDLIWGFAYDCHGTIDGGKGNDDSSELDLPFSALSLLNFED